MVKRKASRKTVVKRAKPIGRPPKYSNPIALQKKIDEYFERELKKDLPVFTISGLIRYCGFADRVSFYDMEKKEAFAYTIKSARLRMSEFYEKRLAYDKCIGAMYWLKCQGREWRETTVIEHQGGIEQKNQDLSKLSKDELLTLQKIQQKLES